MYIDSRNLTLLNRRAFVRCNLGLSSSISSPLDSENNPESSFFRFSASSKSKDDFEELEEGRKSWMENNES